MITVGFILGAAVIGLVALLAVRDMSRLLAAANDLNADLHAERAMFAVELVCARHEVNRLRGHLGQAPLSYPSLADLSRTARSQEESCSSTART